MTAAVAVRLVQMHSRTRELLDYLESQRAVLRDAFEAVPPALRDRPPAPDRWSTAGVVEHLAILEQRIAGMFIAKIAAGAPKASRRKRRSIRFSRWRDDHWSARAHLQHRS
jgi:hypothetical protein